MSAAPFIPFSRPTLGREEIAEAVRTLKSDWFTTGPKTARFEEAFARYVGAPHALALTSATAALHLAFLAAGIGPGDEVITTPMTFAATVNMIEVLGARPVLADIDRRTLNIRPEEIERKITRRTRAVVPVHFAGLACDMRAIGALARRRGVKVIEDAAHAVGTEHRGRKIGADSYIACFSFHPNKNMTTAEGGMLVTSSKAVRDKIKLLRFHGIDREAWKRFRAKGNPHFSLFLPGFKYNLTDLQSSLGLHQLEKLDGFNRRRAAIAKFYLRELAGLDGLELPADGEGHSWHLFAPRFRTERIGLERDEVLKRLGKMGIGTGIHYTAVHLQPYYRKKYGYRRGDFPEAEYVSDRIASLPLFPRLTDRDARRVVGAVKAVLSGR